MDKKQLITEVNDLLETYCEGCFCENIIERQIVSITLIHFVSGKCTVGETFEKVWGTVVMRKHPEKILWMFF